MIFPFCFIHIYPDLTRCCAGLCDLVAGSRSDEVWIKIDVIPYPISLILCPLVLHKRAFFQLVSFKQRTNLLSFSSPFKKLNLLGYLDFIFQIYCFKDDIFLDMNIQEFHAQVQFHLRERFKSFLFKNQIQQLKSFIFL